MPSKSYDIVSAGYLLHGLSPEFRNYILTHMARIAAQYVVVFDYCCRGGWLVRLIERIEGPFYPQFLSSSRSEEFGSAGLKIQKSFQTSTFGKVWVCEKHP
jgi:hypothetical protein